jgi:hypothetical protein
MPRGDGTGPIGTGPRDGRGRRFGGRGQFSTQRGTGMMTGGRKGKGSRGRNQSFDQGGIKNMFRNFFQQFTLKGWRS